MDLSSSTIRTVSIFLLLRNWEPKGKERSLPKGAFYLDLPMVLINDPMGNGEAKANSTLFGGKERIEEFIHIFRRNANARVFYRELYPVMISG
jgi:hypothetical protein